MPTDEPVNTTEPPPEQALAVDLDGYGARAAALLAAREAALDLVLRMTAGDERWEAVDLIDLAEYIRAGFRGASLRDVDAPNIMDIPGSRVTLDEVRRFGRYSS